MVRIAAGADRRTSDGVHLYANADATLIASRTLSVTTSRKSAGSGLLTRTPRVRMMERCGLASTCPSVHQRPPGAPLHPPDSAGNWVSANR